MMAITPKLSKGNATPFASLFLSYCASGMTHIYDDVRLHSLDFLNLWLGAFPTLIVNSNVRLLPHFLSLLSNFDQKPLASQSSSSSAKLLSNPTGKMGSNKSRISVLSTLFRYLDCCISTGKTSNWFDLFQSVTENASVPKSTVFFSPQSPLRVGFLERTPFLESKPLDLALAMEVVEEGEAETAFKENKQFLNNLNLQNLKHCQQFIKVMMPILLECWIEGAPGVSTEFVSAGAATMRASSLMVLEIMLLLWEHHQALLKQSHSPKVSSPLSSRKYRQKKSLRAELSSSLS